MSKAFDFARSIEGSGSYDGLVLPTGSGNGQAGEFRFNSTTGQMEYWSSTSTTPQWRDVDELPIRSFNLTYLVVGGGASGSTYGTNSAIGVTSDTHVGGTDGGDSVFSTITSIGGGAGGEGGYSGTGGAGGSGGGGQIGGAGTPGQGNDGGNIPSGGYVGAGGGGAGAAGGDNTASASGAGGIGAITTIITTSQATTHSVGEVSGSDVYFAGGGGGGRLNSTSIGVGGIGGGGDGGGQSIAPTATLPNSGGGAGGRDSSGTRSNGGGAGGMRQGTLSVTTNTALTVTVGQGGTPPSPFDGSTMFAGADGVVILKYPNTYTATFSAGVTFTSDTDGSNNIRIIKAAGASDTVTFTE